MNPAVPVTKTFIRLPLVDFQGFRHDRVPDTTGKAQELYDTSPDKTSRETHFVVEFSKAEKLERAKAEWGFGV